MAPNNLQQKERENFNQLNQEESLASIVSPDNPGHSQNHPGSSQELLFFDFRRQKGRNVREIGLISVTTKYALEEALVHSLF